MRHLASSALIATMVGPVIVQHNPRGVDVAHVALALLEPCLGHGTPYDRKSLCENAVVGFFCWLAILRDSSINAISILRTVLLILIF